MHLYRWHTKFYYAFAGVRERERTRFHSSIYNVQREIYIQPRQIADKRAIERALRAHENTRM